MGKAIRKLTPSTRQPKKPLHEGSSTERFTPDWDLYPGMGQQYKRVENRYNRYGDYADRYNVGNGKKRSSKD